jgi:anthranilate synthase component 2
MTAVIIDNHDSFTYNIAQCVGALRYPVVVLPNTTPLRVVRAHRPTHVIISPGPGNAADPAACGVTLDAVDHFVGRVPLLGVCLGHQVIGHYFGGRLRRCGRIRHGQVSTVQRLGRSWLLHGMRGEFPAMRYHSHAVERAGLPANLRATAVAINDGELMAFEHESLPVAGVQFHPESVASPGGRRVLRNFLDTSQPTWRRHA